MEENLNIQPSKQKTNKGLLIIIAILILIIAGLLVYIFVLKDDDKETDKNTNTNNASEVTKPSEEDNTNTTEKEEINNTNLNENNKIDEIVAKNIRDFITAATYTNQGDSFLFKKISKGDYNLTKNDKLQLVSLLLVNINEEYDYLKSVPEHLKSNELFNYFNPEDKDILVINKSVFDSEYKRLFKEDIGDYTFNGDYISCPNPSLLDTRENKIYIACRCGGTGNPIFTETSYSTTTDDAYIYVKQSGTYDGKNINIEWKFNKDGKFISMALK